MCNKHTSAYNFHMFYFVKFKLSQLCKYLCIKYIKIFLQVRNTLYPHKEYHIFVHIYQAI